MKWMDSVRGIYHIVKVFLHQMQVQSMNLTGLAKNQ